MAYTKQVITAEQFSDLLDAAVDAVVSQATARGFSLHNDSVAIESNLEIALSEILDVQE